MGESFVEKRRRELGLTDKKSSESPKSQPAQKTEASSSSFVERRKRELGLTPALPAEEPARPKLPLMDINKSPLMNQIKSNARGMAEMDESRMINESRELATPRKLPSFDVRESPLVKEANSPIQGPPMQELPGRKLPVIGPVLRGLDRFSETPVQNFIADAGEMLYTPGGGLANLAGLSRSAGAAVSKLLPSLASTTAGRIGKTALTEAILGAPLGAAATQMHNPNASVGDLAKGALYGAATGGALGAAGKAVVEGAVQFTDKAVNKLAQNAIQKVSANSRTVISPFNEGVAADNPVAKGYTEQVGRTFGQTGRIEIQPPKTAQPPRQQALNSSPLPEQGTQQTDDLIKTKEPRLRDRIYNYLDEAEQAARERLKAKRNTLSSVPVDQWADHAIILAAQAGKGGIRLADATEFLVREFGEEIRPHVRTIMNKARSVAAETERRASREAQEARVFNGADTGDVNSFRSKVSRDINRNRTPFAQKMERARSRFIDDFAALDGLERRVRGRLASAELSLYKSARLFRGVPEKANMIVKERLAPVVKDIESKGYTSADLGDYALAVHAKDVNALDIKSGFTNKEINEVIRQLGTPEMEAARQQLVKVGDDMLEELANTGVISKDLMSSLRERYPNYVPLFRAFDDKAVNFADGLSKAMANVTAPIKGLKGSERQVVDPLENMVKNIFQSTNAAERNKVALQLTKLAEEDADSAFIRKLDDHESVGRKNVVSVLQDGKKVQYEVEPEVYKALLSLDKESSNTLIKILQKPASVLRSGATLTPEFSLRNPLRDVVQAFVTSNSGFNPLIDFPVGLIQSITKGDLYKKWVHELGAYGNIISNDRQVHKEALERVLKDSVGKKFVNVISGKTLIRTLRAISDTTESATKVGEFRAALRQGQTPQEAAYRSRDIMDFGRAGSSIRETNKIVAFLNANIQGKSKIIRAFRENPVGFTARAFTAVTAPTIGVFIAQKHLSNPEQKRIIDEAPGWMKDTFWLMPIPGTDQVARIPKPFDLATLFSNLPERALNYVYNNDKEAFDGFARKALADSALPGMISGLTPFIEGMANYSFFKEGRIISQAEEGRNFEDQFDINTTETAKFLAKGAQYVTGEKGALKNFSSPQVMDNTIQGLTAGLGNYATSAIDALLNGFNFVDNPKRPAKGIAQQPLAKAFLVNPTQSGKSTEKLYDERDRLTREKGSAKLNETEFKDDARLKLLDSQSKAMSDITKEIRKIENDRSMSPKMKRQEIDKLLRQRNDIAVQTMKK